MRSQAKFSARGLDLAKRSLLRAGANLPDRVHYELNATVDYLHLGRWMRLHEHRPPLFRDRNDVFAHLAADCASQPVLYLEFGVAGGASMREWSRLLTHPTSELHGFDSFEGLPTNWILGRPAGHFSQHGEPPVINDPRVRFHPGWFSESLPSFSWPAGWTRLVASFDADLYSSTCEALTFIEPQVRPGTLLYFDEFNHRAHEMKAFEEYLSRSGTVVRAVGATRDFAHVAFEVV